MGNLNRGESSEQAHGSIMYTNLQLQINSNIHFAGNGYMVGKLWNLYKTNLQIVIIAYP